MTHFDYTILPDNSGVVVDIDGKVVFETDPCESAEQTKKLILDWLNIHDKEITLEVKNLSIDANSLFSRMRR